ncbi:MAG: hypothetical protein H5T84_04395, partial [Thermoleophilia bacterium]|nr:hypothetical protein [Thermoleophilia bacterium]
MSKRVFKKLGLLLTAVLVFSLLVPAFPAAAATAKTYIIGVEFVEDELGKVIIETNKAANTADLTKYVKLSGRKGSWEDLGDNCYEGTFSGLRYKYRYTLTATGKFAFKGVSLRDRQYRWTEPTTPPPQQEVQLTLDQTSVSVEQGQSVDVSFTVSPADASVN